MVYKIGGTILLLILWFGFIGPWAVSSDNDIPVIGWILTTAFGGMVLISQFIKRKPK